MASGLSDQTEKTLLHHLQAFAAGDVEAVMADYAADAVLITPDGTLKGYAQIRSVFEQIFTQMFPPDSTSLNLVKQVVEGDIAYILWSATSPHYQAPLGTDTFVMRDGKIIAQTFAAQLEAKKTA
jgi:ketosteroid isomerase-like protein